MVNGFSKYSVLMTLLLCSLTLSAQNYAVTATQLKNDVKDLSQRSSKILDQNGERCALLRFETPVPALFSFQLGAQQIEKRENKEDEVWIWVSADVLISLVLHSLNTYLIFACKGTNKQAKCKTNQDLFCISPA